jgi:hypothetical protein
LDQTTNEIQDIRGGLKVTNTVEEIKGYQQNFIFIGTELNNLPL